MVLRKWEGIVIKTLPYGESNKIITIFTEEAGKISVMARGAKKPRSKLAAVSQSFTHGIYLIRKGRGMGTLSQGETIDSMRTIREDLERTAYASYIVEIIDRLTDENIPMQSVYHLLREALSAINEEIDAEAISLFVEWKMLQVGGIHPFLHACANCSSTEGEFAFSFQYIGFLCHRCFQKDPFIVRLNRTFIRLIRTFYTVPIHQVGNITLKNETKQLMKKIVRTIYDEQLGVYFKSRKFLDTLEKMPELLLPQEKPESNE